MKKLLAFIILSIALVSCYDDYRYDNPYTSIYFPYQIDVRTFVVGEGMKIEVGAALGGVIKNAIDRNVNFTLDNTLVSDGTLTKMKVAPQAYIKNYTIPVTALELLPTNYYTISNPNTMVIKKSQHSGTVTIKADSIAFLNDSIKTLFPTYVLPFRITSADADSILTNKNTNVVGLRFEHMLFGNYWHGGAALVNRPAKSDTTIVYKWAINDPESKIWALTTVGPSTIVTNTYFNTSASSKTELKLVLKGNKVNVSSAAGSSFTFLQDGECTFNRPKLLQDRKIFLKYSFVNNGDTYHCTDTLFFRNRLRDGVNEWEDSNPSHYTK